MFGKIEFFQFAILLLSITSIISDSFKGKIYNVITFPGIILGLFYGATFGGWEGFKHALLGTSLGCALFLWMYLLRFLGAGDVKLLMALGAWSGPHDVFDIAYSSIMLGGMLGLITMLWAGRLLSFCKRMSFPLMSLFISELEFIPPKIDKTLRMPFGIPISISAIGIAFWHPLEKWGLCLWPF